MKWLLVCALILLASCDRPQSSTAGSQSWNGGFQTAPLTADELGLISGWRVLKLSDGPEICHKFYMFRLFTRSADGKQSWLGSSGQSPQKPTYDLRETPLVVAFHQEGKDLLWHYSMQGSVSAKRELFFPAEFYHTECFPKQEGNVFSLFRVMGHDEVPLNEVCVEFLDHPPAENEIRGTPTLTPSKKD